MEMEKGRNALKAAAQVKLALAIMKEAINGLDGQDSSVWIRLHYWTFTIINNYSSSEIHL